MPVLRTLAALLLCASISAAAELKTLAGAVITGDLIGLTDKTLTLKTDAGKTDYPLTSVLSLELLKDVPQPAAAKYTDVELTDGTLFHCKTVAAKGKNLELELVSGQKVTVPLKGISYILNEAQESKVREDWKGIAAKRDTHDIAAIKQEGTVNALEGTFTEGTDEGKLIFVEKKTGDKVPVDPSRLFGLAFVNKPDPAAPDAVCKVLDSSRNSYQATKFALGEKSFTVTLTTGAVIDLTREQIAYIDFNNGKLTYLSDMTPTKVAERSNTGRVEHYRRDKNLEDGPIKIAPVGDGESQLPSLHDKGLSVHAYTELVYDLDKKYKKFEAILAVDDGVEGDSHIKIVIQGDGKDLLVPFEVQRKDKPRALKLDVTGVKELRIVVRSVDVLDFGNHVDLADARVSK